MRPMILATLMLILLGTNVACNTDSRFRPRRWAGGRKDSGRGERREERNCSSDACGWEKL